MSPTWAARQLMHEGGSAEARALVERLEAVRRRIDDAAGAAGRDPASVRLLAVSKHHSVSMMRAAYAAGQRDFGENYVQELLLKQQQLSDLSELRFHMIGHVQRNKARKLAGVVSCVHSVDSVALATELGRRAAAAPVPEGRGLVAGRRLAVLVEVNVSGESQRAGCSPEELADVLSAVAAEPALSLQGLMAIAAGRGEPAQSRPQFEALSALREQHGGTAVLPQLSLGMSRDLEVAVACGSSWVRVGTDIFGPRTASESN